MILNWFLLLLFFQFHFIGGLSLYFDNLSESIFVTSVSFQADGYRIGTYGLFYIEMNISQAFIRVSAPNQGVAGIYFQRVTS